MSGLYIDELDDDDYIPSELHGNDDGIVPDSAYEDGGQFPVLVSSRKKRRNEDMGSGTNRLKSNTCIKREGDMLGRNSWPEKNSGGSPVSGKDVQAMTLEDANISDHGFNGGNADVVENFSTADPMLCDNSAATHDGVHNYSLNNIPDAENNLNFFDNGDKGSNDLLYGWADIGNFEDVDNLLRSCDSTFGLDSLNNEDDMGWLSSAQPNEETECAMTDDLKPDTMLENQRTSMLQVEDFLNNSDSNHTLEDEYGYTVASNSAQGKSSENVSDTSSQKMDILMLDVEANFEKKQIDHLNRLHGKSDGYSENSFTLQNSGISREIMDINQYYPPSEFQQRGGVPYSHSNCEQPSDPVSACESKSGIKSENNPNPSSASNESYTSNQAQSVESLQGQTVDDRCRRGFETRVNLQPGQDMPPSFAASTRKSSKTNPMVFPEAAPIQKIRLENDHRKAAAELETSNMQGSSCVSSVVDDISLEATSFRQLQQVIEQLDVRTKLCIRDSLYRLAKSAEQRHNGGNRQDKGAGSHLVTGETDKYAGFMDIETDTNPIDRSIAHLLFHRPSDSSLSSDNDVLSYKSHPMIPQPNSSPSLRIEKQEETPELRPEAEVVTNDNN